MVMEVFPVANKPKGATQNVRLEFRRQLAAKEVRDNRRYTTVDVARATGVSRQTVSTWLNGHIQVVRLDYLEAVCRFLECRPGDLLVLAADGGEQEAE